MPTSEKEIPTTIHYIFFPTSPMEQYWKQHRLKQHLSIALQQISIEETKAARDKLLELKNETEGDLRWHITDKIKIERDLAELEAALKIATEAECTPAQKEHQERSIKEIRGFVRDYELKLQHRENRIKIVSADIAGINSDISKEEDILSKKEQDLSVLHSTLEKIEIHLALISKQSTFNPMPRSVDENTIPNKRPGSTF